MLDCGFLRSPESHCRLVTTADTIIHELYLSLSHCWGGVDSEIECHQFRSAAGPNLVLNSPLAVPGCRICYSQSQGQTFVDRLVMYYSAGR